MKNNYLHLEILPLSPTAAASPVGIDATPDDDAEQGIYLIFISNIKNKYSCFRSSSNTNGSKYRTK